MKLFRGRRLKHALASTCMTIPAIRLETLQGVQRCSILKSRCRFNRCKPRTVRSPSWLSPFAGYLVKVYADSDKSSPSPMRMARHCRWQETRTQIGAGRRNGKGPAQPSCGGLGRPGAAIDFPMLQDLPCSSVIGGIPMCQWQSPSIVAGIRSGDSTGDGPPGIRPNPFRRADRRTPLDCCLLPFSATSPPVAAVPSIAS